MNWTGRKDNRNKAITSIGKGDRQLATILLVAVVTAATVVGLTSPALAAEKQPLVRLLITIGAPRPDGVIALHAAKELGYFDKEGVNVSLEWVRGGALGMKAMLAGQADMMWGGSGEVITAVAQGRKMKIILNPVVGPLMVLVADKRFNSVNDLKGAVLGT